MIVSPKRRKILRYKRMKELGLNPKKIQFLFVVENNNIELYSELIEKFRNPNVEINIFTQLDDLERLEKFNYFKDGIEELYEICEASFLTQDDRILAYDYDIIDSISQLNTLKTNNLEEREDEICVVLSHCDTQEKKEVLTECIDVLKNQNKKIILSSHISVDADILEMVDYFVCDKANEMINHTEFGGDGATFQYYNFPGYSHKFYYDNHAFAVLKLMIEGVQLANTKGYKKIHLIHYDSVIYDRSLLKKMYYDLDKFDIVHFFFPQYIERMDGNFFSIKTETFLNIFSKIKSKSDFISYKKAIFEEFLYKICYYNDLKIRSSNIEYLFYKNIIDKIKMMEFGCRKHYDDDMFTDTFIIPSIDINNQKKYISLVTTDTNVTYLSIQMIIYPIDPLKINIYELSPDLDDTIILNIPYLEKSVEINKSTKLAECDFCDPDGELIHYQVVKKSSILETYDIKNDFIETIPGENFSLVHKRCLSHTGCIVDLGCLNWDWSLFFIGKKRIIGVDPQENEIIQTTIFKGAVSNYTGFGKLSTTGETAHLIKSESGFPVLTWRDFTRRYEINKVSILKINIEGGEYELLKSMTTQDFYFIDQIAVSFHDIDEKSPQEKQKCLEILSQNNYHIFDLDIYGWYLFVKNINN